QRAATHRNQRQGGMDPLSAKEVERQARRGAAAKARIFRDVAEEDIARKQGEWNNAKNRVQWAQNLAAYVYPIIGHLPVAAIDVDLVLKVLEPLWGDRVHLASRIRGRIELVLDAATVRGYRTGANPAQWKGNLAHILPARAKLHRVKHHPALPFDELPAFMVQLREQ